MRTWQQPEIIVDFLRQVTARRFSVEINVEVFEPENMDFGDWTTNVPFKLAKIIHKSPEMIAQELMKEKLPDFISSVEFAGKGFLNFRLSKSALNNTICEVLFEPSEWGKCEIAQKGKIQLEFVSANPTGPLNIVSARASAVGSTLANALKYSGQNVATEFYVNDAGNQIDLLTKSFKARISQLKGDRLEIPDDGYHGEYLVEYAKEYVNSGANESEERWILGHILKSMRETLTSFHCEFDNWFSESEFRKTDKVQQVLNRLIDKGVTYTKDGALWFSTSNIDSKIEDFVLLKSDGEYSYSLVDIAYHSHKFEERGFDRVYTILGPDHHGHKSRIETAMEVLGHGGKLKVLTLQQVNLIENGERMMMSKRAGKLITMDELIDDVGVDAGRYFFITRRMDAHLDFDLDLARKTSEENPVYYIQYAHARICGILRHSEAKGFSVEEIKRANLALLNESEEIRLMRKITKFPQMVKSTAVQLQPHFIPFYLLELSRDFHSFYTVHRVVSENRELSLARLALCSAVAKTISIGLSICGISAPEQM